MLHGLILASGRNLLVVLLHHGIHFLVLNKPWQVAESGFKQNSLHSTLSNFFLLVGTSEDSLMNIFKLRSFPINLSISPWSHRIHAPIIAAHLFFHPVFTTSVKHSVSVHDFLKTFYYCGHIGCNRSQQWLSASNI